MEQQPEPTSAELAAKLERIERAARDMISAVLGMYPEDHYMPSNMGYFVCWYCGKPQGAPHLQGCLLGISERLERELKS